MRDDMACSRMKLLKRFELGCLPWKGNHTPQNTRVRRKTCDGNSYMVVYAVHLLLIRGELSCGSLNEARYQRRVRDSIAQALALRASRMA